MLIINGIIHTMDGPVIENGYVAVEGSKIAQVGPMSDCPAKWRGESHDAPGGRGCPACYEPCRHLASCGGSLGLV